MVGKFDLRDADTHEKAEYKFTRSYTSMLATSRKIVKLFPIEDRGIVEELLEQLINDANRSSFYGMCVDYHEREKKSIKRLFRFNKKGSLF